MTTSAELVQDPVSHISISGVKGRDELEARLAHAEVQYSPPRRQIGQLVVAALIGAAVMYMLRGQDDVS